MPRLTLKPELRTNLLLAALPLGLAILAAGIEELDKIITGRQRRLDKLEVLIRDREARLVSLGGARFVTAEEDASAGQPGCGCHVGAGILCPLHEAEMKSAEAAAAAAP